jgi:hypothetical protein
MRKESKLCTISVNGFVFVVHCKAIYEEEERLMKMLLKHAIHPDVLPMVNGPVRVRFGLTLNQIVDVVRIDTTSIPCENSSS